ncbi:hypothetical protein Tco_0917615, partial [Tanacetum coccineum]
MFLRPTAQTWSWTTTAGPSVPAGPVAIVNGLAHIRRNGSGHTMGQQEAYDGEEDKCMQKEMAPSSLNALLFDVHYDGIFIFVPLRYENDVGLKIVECDSDLDAMYEFAYAYGIIQMYLAHIPLNLVEYYFKNFCFDESGDENAPDATLDVDEFDYGDTGASFESVDDQT